MSRRWKSGTFGSAPLEIIDGDRGKEYPKQDDFLDDGYCLFLDAGNVTAEGFDFSQCHFISEQKDQALRKGRLCRDDVVLTTRGTIGNCGFFDEKIPYENLRINSGMVIFRTKPEELMPAFLYHCLRSPGFKGQVNALRSGVAQPQLPIRDIKRIQIPLPDPHVQRCIADILSSYDDLIENNRRRMELLEEAARQLYREWFVRLRFPGREHTRIINEVPEGWERKKLANVAEVNRESLGNCFDGEIEYVDIASVTPGQINQTTLYGFNEAPSRARRVVRHGDIIWSCVRPNRRSHAVIWQPGSNLIVSTGFAVITPTSLPTSFLYQATTTDSFTGYLVNHARGAAYPAVVAGDFERAEILTPSKSLVDAFNDFAEPLLAQGHKLRLQNQKLRGARDLLLPRLMSGEIAV